MALRKMVLPQIATKRRETGDDRDLDHGPRRGISLYSLTIVDALELIHAITDVVDQGMFADNPTVK